MKSGFHTGRDAVTPALTGLPGEHQASSGWENREHMPPHREDSNARMDNMDASLATCWRGVGRTHCTWRAKVPRKDYLSSRRPLPSIFVPFLPCSGPQCHSWALLCPLRRKSLEKPGQQSYLRVNELRSFIYLPSLLYMGGLEGSDFY